MSSPTNGKVILVKRPEFIVPIVLLVAVVLIILSVVLFIKVKK